jgi:hypothetical protein
MAGTEAELRDVTPATDDKPEAVHADGTQKSVVILLLSRYTRTLREYRSMIATRSPEPRAIGM